MAALRESPSGKSVLDSAFGCGEDCVVKLIFSPAAAKALIRMPDKEAGAMLAKLSSVASDPLGFHPWAKRLTGHPGFRVRQGDWQAIYRLDHETGDMVVDRIAKRDEVYG
ncbi:mRNA interferase RelE/StbE [Azospirillaceae bacterium]